jgi:hypothetical protein
MDQKVKVMMKESPWVPLTITKGGQAANFLVKALQSEWGRKLYAKTLLKQISQSVYRVGFQSCERSSNNSPDQIPSYEVATHAALSRNHG